MTATARILSCFVSHEIGCDSEKPGSLVHDVVLPERTDERLLCYLFSPVAITQTPRQVAHQRGVVGFEETFDVAQAVTIVLLFS
jgi:hypothetical protein